MALSESAIKKNKKSNKRKAFIKNEAKENDRFTMGKIVNKMVTMFGKDPVRTAAMQEGMEENNERSFPGGPFNRPEIGMGLSKVKPNPKALREAAALGLMGATKNSKGSSAKLVKKKKPKGVGIASRGYGKAMK